MQKLLQVLARPPSGHTAESHGISIPDESCDLVRTLDGAIGDSAPLGPHSVHRRGIRLMLCEFRHILDRDGSRPPVRNRAPGDCAPECEDGLLGGSPDQDSNHRSPTDIFEIICVDRAHIERMGYGKIVFLVRPLPARGETETSTEIEAVGLKTTGWAVPTEQVHASYAHEVLDRVRVVIAASPSNNIA